MLTPKTTATYVLAAAMFALAGASVYFSIVLTRVLIAIPGLADEIEVTAERIEPIVNEVHAIQVQIPLILEEVALIREQIPPILDEVEAIRLAIPPVLEETGEIRGVIPPILEEFSAVRGEIPSILARIDAVEQQVPFIIAEVGEVRATIPSIIEQVEAIRAEIPEHLDQAERISLNIETAGKKAGEGAVTGVFTGIIKAPMSIVSGIGGSVFTSSELNEQDHKEIGKAMEKLVEGGKVGDSVDWRNQASGAQGKVSVVEFDKTSEPPCMLLNITAYRRYKKIGEGTVTVCQSEDGTWKFVGVE